MIVEKQSDNSNLSNFDAQSALVITAKDQVKKKYYFSNLFLIYTRVEYLFFLNFLIEYLFLINYRVYYHNLKKQSKQLIIFRR